MVAWRVSPAVVYPASGVGPRLPVPTGKLRPRGTSRCKRQGGGGRLPEVLPASRGVGCTRLAMMGDHSTVHAVVGDSGGKTNGGNLKEDGPLSRGDQT